MLARRLAISLVILQMPADAVRLHDDLEQLRNPERRMVERLSHAGIGSFIGGIDAAAGKD